MESSGQRVVLGGTFAVSSSPSGYGLVVVLWGYTGLMETTMMGLYRGKGNYYDGAI